MTLDPGEVRAAADAWIWVPTDAAVVDRSEYLLVAYPEHFADPTMCFRFASDRPAAEVVEDVLRDARDLGRPAVTFAGLRDDTRPSGLAAELEARGAELVETVSVLALDLESVPQLDVPEDVEVRPVLDLSTLADLDHVSTTVFGGRPRSREELAGTLPGVRSEDPPRLVAYRAGRAVGSAGSTWAPPALRLWGASVLPESRGGGVYRALLAHRLRSARGLGARLALVKGRVETSAPILRRAGFAAYGEERSLRLSTQPL